MYVIALIGIGLVIHGFIMLAFAAFRARLAWGLAVLFIPFAQVFFPIYHWDYARKPFMTFTFGMAMWLGTAIVFGQGPLDKFWLDQIDLVESAEQFSSQFREPKPLSLEERAKKLDNRDLKRTATKVTAKKSKRFLSEVSINAANSKRFIGKNVKVTLNNTNVRNGKLVAAEKEKITLQYVIGGRAIGSMTYEIAYHDISMVEEVDY